MLSAAHRMRASSDFDAAVRKGVRSGRRTLVVHLTTVNGTGEPNRVLAGFVVSKAVGNAVTRNRVKRRLRAIVRDEIAGLASPSRVVVRALPASADATFEELRHDLGEALTAAVRKSSGGVRR